MKRPYLTLLFLGLLAVPAFLRRPAPPPPAPPGASSASLERYGFQLTEVAAASGIRFAHENARLDPKLEHIMPQVAALGAAVAVSDFDRDGYPDFYATTSKEGARNALYRNRGDGTFEDVAAAMGVADLNQAGHGCSTGAIWGDVDNDGYEDLLVYRWGPPALFRNLGGQGFAAVTSPALPKWANVNSAIWFDFDRDGKLDLLLAGYWDERFDLWHLTDTKVMPDSFEYATNGGRKYLLRGNGDFTFEDVTEKLGMTSRRWALAVGAADLSGSGYPDVFIANDYGVSELYRNERGQGFVEVGKQTGIGAAPKSGMNVSFGDVMNRGQLGVYVSNISEEGVLLQGNNLWMPQYVGKRGLVGFDNQARAMGVELGGWSFGAQFGDLDNDGDLDLYLVNGYISANPKESYWYDFSKIAAGHGMILVDAANWPPMKGRSLAGYQEKRVWLNYGTGRFTDVAAAVGVTDRLDGRAVAFADFGNRGVNDVLVASQQGPLLLYRNTVRPDHAWVGLDLEGTASNRSAIGVRVTLRWNGKQQVQEVHGGIGFSSQNDRRLHFGLGRIGRPPAAVIRWPSGKEQVIESLEPGRMHKLKEPA